MAMKWAATGFRVSATPAKAEQWSLNLDLANTARTTASSPRLTPAGVDAALDAFVGGTAPAEQLRIIETIVRRKRWRDYVFDTHPDLQPELHVGPEHGDQNLVILRIILWSACDPPYPNRVQRAQIPGGLVVQFRRYLITISHAVQVLQGTCPTSLRQACLALQSSLARLDGGYDPWTGAQAPDIPLGDAMRYHSNDPQARRARATQDILLALAWAGQTLCIFNVSGSKLVRSEYRDTLQGIVPQLQIFFEELTAVLSPERVTASSPRVDQCQERSTLDHLVWDDWDDSIYTWLTTSELLASCRQEIKNLLVDRSLVSSWTALRKEEHQASEYEASGESFDNHAGEHVTPEDEDIGKGEDYASEEEDDFTGDSALASGNLIEGGGRTRLNYDCSDQGSDDSSLWSDSTVSDSHPDVGANDTTNDSEEEDLSFLEPEPSQATSGPNTSRRAALGMAEHPRIALRAVALCEREQAEQRHNRAMPSRRTASTRERVSSFDPIDALEDSEVSADDISHHSDNDDEHSALTVANSSMLPRRSKPGPPPITQSIDGTERSYACSGCRRFRRCCDRKFPSCSPCVQRLAICQYVDPSSEKGKRAAREVAVQEQSKLNASNQANAEMTARNAEEQRTRDPKLPSLDVLDLIATIKQCRVHKKGYSAHLPVRADILSNSLLYAHFTINGHLRAASPLWQHIGDERLLDLQWWRHLHASSLIDWRPPKNDDSNAGDGADFPAKRMPHARVLDIRKRLRLDDDADDGGPIRPQKQRRARRPFVRQPNIGRNPGEGYIVVLANTCVACVGNRERCDGRKIPCSPCSAANRHCERACLTRGAEAGNEYEEQVWLSCKTCGEKLMDPKPTYSLHSGIYLTRQHQCSHCRVNKSYSVDDGRATGQMWAKNLV